MYIFGSYLLILQKKENKQIKKCEICAPMVCTSTPSDFNPTPTHFKDSAKLSQEFLYFCENEEYLSSLCIGLIGKCKSKTSRLEAKVSAAL